MKLDLLDRKIIAQLDADARQPFSTLAKNLHIPRERLEYRYERLIREEIIKQKTVTINPYKIGLTLYKTYLKLQKGGVLYTKLLKALKNHPHVYWIAECDGRWDLMYALFAHTPFEFHTVQQELLNSHREALINFEVYTLVNVWVYGRDYLTGKKTAPFLVGGAPSNYPLDPIEWKILQQLSLDARQSVPDIAQSVSATETIVRYRIKNMEEAGLIARYRVELDYPKMGISFFKAQLYLNCSSRDQLATFKKYCAAHPHITYFIEQIGECELELEIEADGYEQFTSIINELRVKFSNVIRTVETVLIRRTHFNWVPYEAIKNTLH